MRVLSPTIIAAMLCIVSKSQAVNVTSIEQLDDLAVFSFSIMSDHGGTSSLNPEDIEWPYMIRVEDWIKRNNVFCFGLGDHFNGTGDDTFQTIMQNDPYFHNHFYPNIGDGENQIRINGVRGDQGHWGRGWVTFNYLNDFYNRSNVEFRQPGGQVNSYGTWYDDQLVDYYAFFNQGAFTVHLISLHYGDDSAFATPTKDFMMQKLQELSATKTDYDIIVVLAHSKGNFVTQAIAEGAISGSERDFLMETADLIADASEHKYRRHHQYDSRFDGTEALWVNSGAVIETGSTYGYIDIHVLDNPPRFTCQYVFTKINTERKLHVGQLPKISDTVDPTLTVPYIKYINGTYAEVDWSNFSVAASANDAEFITQTVPDSIAPGQTIEVQVTMKNTGQSAWSTAEGHQLASRKPDNNTTWGFSTVPLTETVQPGDEYTFVFNVTAPSSQATYDFQWRMADNVGANQGGFGESTLRIPVEVRWPLVNLVKNPSFELGGVGPSDWSLGSGSIGSSDESQSGDASLKFSGGSNTRQTIALSPNTDYELSFWALASGMTSGGARFDTSDKFDPGTTPGGNGQFIINAGDALGWTKYKGSFNSSSETSVTIRMFHSSMVGEIYFDNISLVETNPDNYAPVITSLPPKEATPGQFYSYTVTGVDADGDSMNFSVTAKPAWLNFNSGTRILSGTPGGGDAGEATVTLAVSDGNLSTDQTFSIAVGGGNQAPQINSIPSSFAEISIPYSYTMTATDLEGDNLTFSSLSVPSWLSFNSGARVLSGIPSSGDFGAHSVELNVTDGNTDVSQSFSIFVSNVGNDDPLVNSTAKTGAIEGEAYSYAIDVIDPDGDALMYSASSLPGWLSLNSSSGLLSGTAGSSDLGNHSINITVSDGSANVTQNFILHVFEAQVPADHVLNGSFEQGGAVPSSWNIGSSTVGSTSQANDGSSALMVSGGASNTKQDVSLSPNTDYTLSVWVLASDVTSGGIRFDTNDKFDSVDGPNGPGGSCQFTINTGSASVWTQFTGSFNSASETSVTLRIYTSSMIGTAYVDNVVLIPSSGGGGNVTPIFTSTPITSADEDSFYTYTASVADTDEMLTLSAVLKPTWLSFDGNTGILSGTPGSSEVGDHQVTLRVSDGQSSSDQSFSITVTAAPDPYRDWKNTNNVIDDVADNDDDGISNLMEFALGGDPNVADRLNIPTVHENMFTMDFKFQRNEPTVTYTVEKSTDLINWSDHAVVSDTHGLVGTEATVPVVKTEMAAGKLFLRLKVEN